MMMMMTSGRNMQWNFLSREVVDDEAESGGPVSLSGVMSDEKSVYSDNNNNNIHVR